MIREYSVAQILATAFPPNAAVVAAALALVTIAFIFVRKREVGEGWMLFLVTAMNPFILIAMAHLANPFPALFVAAAILCFSGVFVLGEHRDDRGVVAFAIGAAAGIALIGSAPVLYAPLALASPLLSPWKKSASQLVGFTATIWAPSIMALAAAGYLAWLYPYTGAAGPGSPAIGLAISPSNFFALAAAPSVLLGMAAPGIAGGSRGAAVVAGLTLASACLLAPPDAFMALGALAFSAEAAWTARLRRGGAVSLAVAGAFCAFLVWRHIGEPATIAAAAAALSKLH